MAEPTATQVAQAYGGFSRARAKRFYDMLRDRLKMSKEQFAETQKLAEKQEKKKAISGIAGLATGVGALATGVPVLRKLASPIGMLGGTIASGGQAPGGAIPSLLGMFQAGAERGATEQALAKLTGGQLGMSEEEMIKKWRPRSGLFEGETATGLEGTILKAPRKKKWGIF